MKIKTYLLVAATVLSCKLVAQVSAKIHVNQVGYYTEGPKFAAIIGTGTSAFTIVSSTGQEVLTGQTSSAINWNKSGEMVQTADFSELNQAGTYKLVIAGVGESYAFTVSNNVLENVSKESVRYFYYNRCSFALEQQYAGIYARPSGHADNDVLVCDNNFPGGRPVNSRFASPGGWYDAGDYNKYIQTAGISVYTLLSAYEQHPAFVRNLRLNIPESNNNLPDLLDECLFELQWMLTMQDSDGGVYTKLTNQGFGSMTDMPAVHESKNGQRYVCKKNTPATLQFVASMAAAYRILEPFAELATLRTNMLDAAKKGWEWSRVNGGVPAGQCACSIVTGAYGDASPSDELTWAACEMYLATGDITYYNTSSPRNSAINTPDWTNNKQVLGIISLLLNQSKLTGAALNDVATLKQKLKTYADGLVNEYRANPYRFAKTDSWNWGSNGDAGNQSFVLLSANAVMENNDYRDAALSNLDYILGRNPTNYCMITGFGSKKIDYVHHRISQADGINEPVPGMVVGGALDKVTSFVTSNFPTPSSEYAMTEVTINWNAPFAFSAVSLQALFAGACPKIELGNDISICINGSNPVILSTGLTDGPIQWFKDGQQIQGQSGTTLNIPDPATAAGIYRADYQAATCTATDVMAITALMQKPNLGDDRALVGGSLLLDAGVSGSNVLYRWYADGERIIGADAQTFTARKPDVVYRAEVSTAECAPQFDEITALPPRRPYGAIPKTLPGTINASEYDEAYIPGATYYDTGAGNSGGALRNDDVDVEESTTGGGYNIGYTAAGEWTEYTVNALKSGTYRVTFTVASSTNVGSFSVTSDGTPLVAATSVSLSQSAGWQDWKTITVSGISLKAGIHVLRFNVLAANFNWKSMAFSLETETSVLQTLELAQGWNLISFKTLPADPAFATIFVDKAITTVKSEDGFYRNDQPAFLNSITTVELGQGYLVYAASPKTISITGSEWDFTVTKTIEQLKMGWNMIGTVNNTLQVIDLPANISQVKDFDEFHTAGGQGNLSQLVPGKGYYVFKE